MSETLGQFISSPLSVFVTGGHIVWHDSQCRLQWLVSLLPDINGILERTLYTQQRPANINHNNNSYNNTQSIYMTLRNYDSREVKKQNSIQSGLTTTLPKPWLSSEVMQQQDAVGDADGILRPGAAIWRSRPNNVVWCPIGASTWWTGRNKRAVVFGSGLFPVLYENMTSSTKPEIHNISHCRQRGTKPRQQVTIDWFDWLMQ